MKKRADPSPSAKRPRIGTAYVAPRTDSRSDGAEWFNERAAGAESWLQPLLLAKPAGSPWLRNPLLAIWTTALVVVGLLVVL